MSEFFNRAKTDLTLKVLEVVIIFSFFITAIGIIASSTTVSPILIAGIILLILSICSVFVVCHKDSKF